MNNQLGLNFGAIIKNVAVEMYGHEVGEEIRGTITGSQPGQKYDTVKPVIVLDKKPIIARTVWPLASLWSITTWPMC
jgi:hypothetical protein